MQIIQVNNVSKNYQYYRKQAGLAGSLKNLFWREMLSAHAVKDISFSVEEGELVGFLGPNGAGKTTTLKMLSGIVHPSSGDIRVLGYQPWKREPAYQKQFSLIMGQKTQLWTDLPAMDSFMLTKEIYEMSDSEYRKNLDELIEVLDAHDFMDIQVRKLSLGQRMKCELIAALLHKPKVLFLDEPTIGLDVVAQKNIRDFIKKYNQEKKTTIMLTSHYMEDIKELCDRVIIINLGTIIYDGKLDDLIKKYDPHKALKISFNGNGVKRNDIERFGAVEEYSPFLCVMRVPRDEAKKRAAALLASDLPVDDILIEEVAIDDVVREIFKQ